MERAAPLKVSFNTSLKFLIKVSLNKEICPFSQKTLGKERPSIFPKRRALMGTDVNLQSLN